MAFANRSLSRKKQTVSDGMVQLRVAAAACMNDISRMPNSMPEPCQIGMPAVSAINAIFTNSRMSKPMLRRSQAPCLMASIVSAALAVVRARGTSIFSRKSANQSIRVGIGSSNLRLKPSSRLATGRKLAMSG